MMNKNTKPIKVNSWTEFGRLRTVVVGRADNACHYEVDDPSQYEIPINDEYIKQFIDWPKGKVKKILIDNANRELDNLAKVFENYGVKVLRPTPIDFSQKISTPGWSTRNMFCCVCPRDLMITIGNSVVEATMCERNRFFEYLSYRDIMYKLFDEDKKFKWTSAPKQSMNNDMYWQGFRQKYTNWNEKTAEEKYGLLHDFKYFLNDKEIAFDAATMLRIGKDVFIVHGCMANPKAIEWLSREFEGKVRFHRLNFKVQIPDHIDCILLALRPPRNGRKGILISNPDRPLFDEYKKIFLDNDWEIHMVPRPNKINYPMPPFCYCSAWLSMNILSIDENTVICEENEDEMHAFLENLGFTVVKVPFRNVYMFGGGLHCATWDIEREDTDEDFFPNQ